MPLYALFISRRMFLLFLLKLLLCGVLWRVIVLFTLFIRNIGNSFLRVNNVKFSSPPTFSNSECFIFKFPFSNFKFRFSNFDFQNSQNQKSNFICLCNKVHCQVFCVFYIGESVDCVSLSNKKSHLVLRFTARGETA